MAALFARIVSAIFGSRTLIYGIITVTLGLIFYNLICEIIQEMLDFTLTEINGTSFDDFANPSFSGFAGWCLGQLKVPEIIAVVTSAVSIKFILRKIPFVKW